MPEVRIKLPKLYKWQDEVVNTPKRHRLIVVSRRAGKTLTARTVAIKELLKGRKVLWIAPVHQQTKEQYLEIYQRLEPLITSSEKAKEITLVNGGKLWTRSADNPHSLRSLGYDLVIFDEFAFMNAETWATVRPTLSDHGTGRALIISTPNGHNFMHEMYSKHLEDPEWFIYKHDYTCSPHLTHEEIEKARKEMTPNDFRQEYEAEFISPKGALFESEWLKDIFIEQKDWPETFQRSIIGTDYSTGDGKNCDWQVVVFAGWLNNILYVNCYCDRMSIEKFNQKIKYFYDLYKPESGICVETNFLQHLSAHNLVKLWVDSPPPPIWEIDNKVKKEIRIGRLATLLARKQLKILNNSGGIEAYHELSDFPLGQHDDVLDAIEQSYRGLINI